MLYTTSLTFSKFLPLFSNYKESSDSDSNAEDSDSDSDASLGARRKMPLKKGKKVTKGKAVSIVSNDSKISSSPTPRKGLHNSNTLFGILKKGKITEKDINHWISVFKSDRVGAMCDLVNFLLQCAGAQKDWIRRDVDLEALEAEELDELLANMILSMHENSLSSPLDGHNKESKKMRERFVSFWESLTNKIIAKDDGNTSQDSKAIETLQVITDQLVALSSMIVMSVRDVVTEASLTIGRKISSKLVDLRSMVKIAERQLKAETSKQGTTKQQKTVVSKKAVAVQKEKAAFDRQVIALTELCETIFNSIFIHRHKDSRDDIRAHCAKNLGEWIATDLQHFGKDEFLKYIGWLCSDASKEVRKASIESLIKVVETESLDDEPLQSFVEYFINRFIEIACGDEDEECTFQMLVALRSMQDRGLLDFVTESQLDHIDMKVFDPEASQQIRQEALYFMMDHTQGFQDGDEEENEEESQKATTSKKKGAANISTTTTTAAAAAMANRRKMAMKLETFAEFVEHHQGKDNLTIPSEILCQTCLSLEKCKKWVRDWSTMTLLLLREGDELTSNNLNDTQCAVLLRILAYSAKDLKYSIDKINTNLTPQEKQGRSKKAILATNDEIDFDLLSEELVKSLPKLLIRFRDDEDNLNVLADLLPCCNVSSGSLHQKSLKSILSTTMDLLTTTHNQYLIEKLCFALQTWNKLGGTSQSQVESTIRDLLSFSLEKLENTQDVITSIASSLSSTSKNTKSGSVSGKKNSIDENNIHDALYGLSSSITLLKCLAFNVDFRSLTNKSLSVISDKLISASELLIGQCDVLSLEGLKSRPVLKTCIKGLQHTARCIHSFLIWGVRDVFNSSEELRDNDDMNPPASIIDTLELREKVVNIIHSWLKIGAAEDNNPNLDLELDYKRSIQFTAFEIVGDLRLIFATRLQQYRFLDSLLWMPSKEFLDDLRLVFEKEEEHIRMELETLQESLEDTPEDAIPGSNTQALTTKMNKIAFRLVDKLLAPVSQVMIYDIENINRRQAAAILMHIQSPYDVVKKFVKEWVKELKRLAVVKLLEIQLVTLKMFFEDRVVITINKYSEMVDDNEFDEIEAIDHINDQLQMVMELAKTLSSSMFVGKAKGESLEALGKLFLLGMEYAFSNGISSNIKFLNVLTPYIKLLEPIHLQTITEYYDNHIMNLDINLDDDEPIEIDSFDLSDISQILKDYRATLIGGKIISARSKRVKAAAKQVQTTTDNTITISTSDGVKRNQRKIQAIDDVQYDTQEPGLSFTSVTKPKKNAGLVGLHLESIGDYEEYDSESDYDIEKGGTVKKAKPGGTVLKRSKERSSVPTLSLEEQNEEDDDNEEEQRGGTAVKAKRGGTVMKRGRGRSSAPFISLEEQDESQDDEEEEYETKRPKTSERDVSDDSDSDNDIATWNRSSTGRRR